MSSGYSRFWRLGALLLLVALPRSASAQQPGSGVVTDSLARQVERLQRAIDSLRSNAERQTQRLIELDERGASPAAAAGATRDSARRSVTSASGIYGKPFVRRFGSGTSVGGYVDVEYIRDLSAGRGAFDAHRLVPFIFSEITDRLHFGTEIEFEHGPGIEVSDGVAEGNGEIKVEFATIDYRLTDALNVRGGIILSPLGRFNLVHDSPVNDLTDRPLVARQVIPTTLSETGVGFFGTIYPSERSLLSYEAYVVNGFTDALVADAESSGRISVRGARGFRGGVDYAAPNFVGRVTFSPLLGLEVGTSAHVGDYASANEADAEGERLSIYAIDATVSRGRLELLGEFATLTADLADSLQGLGIAAKRQGYYAQANWHFGHGVLVPRTSSVFTGVVRWDAVDFARGETGDAVQRLTLGLNWRPVEDAVLKTDLLWNWTTPRGSSRRDGSRGLRVSMATYF